MEAVNVVKEENDGIQYADNWGTVPIAGGDTTFTLITFLMRV